MLLFYWNRMTMDRSVSNDKGLLKDLINILHFLNLCLITPRMLKILSKDALKVEKQARTEVSWMR